MTRTTRTFMGAAAAVLLFAVVVVAIGPPFASNEAASEAAPTDAEPAAATAAKEKPPVPPVATVDYFELGPDGTATVAGRTSPGARVRLLLDGEDLTTFTADASGSFAGLSRIEAASRPRALTFEVDGQPGESDAILVQPGRGAAPATAPATPLDDTAIIVDSSGLTVDPDRLSDPDVAVAPPIKDESAPDPQTTVATSAPVTDPPQTPTLPVNTAAQNPPQPVADPPVQATVAVPPAPNLIVTAEGVRSTGTEQPTASVALDAISYDARGEVTLTGRAPAVGGLRIYLDNRPISDSPLSPSGDWQARLPQVDPGTYTLRIDQMGADGTVESRIETPFRKEDPAQIRALRDAGTGVQRIDTRTVQAGHTLWAFATDRFDDGMMYVAIFQANADRIRDPDLIYPGQVFVLPDADASGNPGTSP